MPMSLGFVTGSLGQKGTCQPAPQVTSSKGKMRWPRYRLYIIGLLSSCISPLLTTSPSLHQLCINPSPLKTPSFQEEANKRIYKKSKSIPLPSLPPTIPERRANAVYKPLPLPSTSITRAPL